MDGEKGTLLPPFTAIPGLGETAAISIVENRVGRTFISQEELLAACPKVSKTHVAPGRRRPGHPAGDQSDELVRVSLRFDSCP